MATTDPAGWSRAPWRTSSYSANGGNCIEVAPAGAAVAVRDSKDPDGPKLVFSPAAWRAFAARASGNSGATQSAGRVKPQP